MSKAVESFIHWIPIEEGGRANPPGGSVYSTVARFEDDEKWPHEAWSLVIRVGRSFKGGRYTHAKMEFLAEDAPQHLLKEGARFELLEGRKRVAKGVILPAGVPIPAEINEFESALVG
jgi:hypothetical protein